MAERERVDLSGGGVAAVFLGKNVTLPPDWVSKPQVMTIDTCNGLDLKNKIVPANAKICIVTEDVPRMAYMVMTGECHNRNIPFVVRKGRHSIVQFLYQLFKPIENGDSGPVSIPLPEDTPQARGRIKRLLEEFQFQDGESTADAARRLHVIAKERGIITTYGSLAQAISKYKRDRGMGERPRSAMSGQQLAVKTLSEAISSLNDILDYVTKVEEENASLRTQLAAIKKAIGVVS